MDDFLEVQVREVRRLTNQVNAYSLVPAGGALPPFAPGAHVNVMIAEGLIRPYSLCGDPDDPSSYVIAVKREDGGRGGSKLLHELVQQGGKLKISVPRNNFAFRLDAQKTILIAGGIGLTPLLPMLRALIRAGRDATLHCCTRSPEETPFLEELTRGPLSSRVQLHHDGGVPGRGLDLGTLLKTPSPGTVVYCCGPSGLMSAVEKHTSHWPVGTVHFESFGPATAQAQGKGATRDAPFEVQVKSSGEVLAVPAGRSLLHVLLENGVFLQSSCEQGTCGSCALRVLEGTVDHRDSVLSGEERAQGKMTACVSRACGARLVLDL